MTAPRQSIPKICHWYFFMTAMMSFQGWFLMAWWMWILGENILEEEEDWTFVRRGKYCNIKYLKRLFNWLSPFHYESSSRYTCNTTSSRFIWNARICYLFISLLKRYMQEEGVPFKIVCSRVPLKLPPTAGLAGAAICRFWYYRPLHWN